MGAGQSKGLRQMVQCRPADHKERTALRSECSPLLAVEAVGLEMEKGRRAPGQRGQRGQRRWRVCVCAKASWSLGPAELHPVAPRVLEDVMVEHIVSDLGREGAEGWERGQL